jgi:putative acetyltransferase
LSVRRARPDEADTLLAIQREASIAAFSHVFPPELYAFPDDAVRERWREAIADAASEVYVAEDDGVPVGALIVERDWLVGLYVVPAHWGTGVGSALHDHALERLRALGSERAQLWTLEGNERARRFYEQRGWTLNGETRVVPFPPHPIDVGYSLGLSSTR